MRRKRLPGGPGYYDRTGGNYPIVRGPWKGGTGATPDYVSYHKQWTEEVLQEQGGRGQTLSNRFFIGSYDTGISDMRTEPLQDAVGELVFQAQKEMAFVLKESTLLAIRQQHLAILLYSTILHPIP